jgi:hypothetical protein
VEIEPAEVEVQPAPIRSVALLKSIRRGSKRPNAGHGKLSSLDSCSRGC